MFSIATGLLSQLSIRDILGASLGAIVMFMGYTTYNTLYALPQARMEAREAIYSEIREKTNQILLEKAKNDKELSNFTSRDLCIELLPDGVPESFCD